MPKFTLGQKLSRNKAAILEELIGFFERLPETPYRNLMLYDEDGRRRLEFWTGLALEVLDKSPDNFYSDQSSIGYRRAREGFSLSDLANVHKFFIKSVLKVLQVDPDYAEPLVQTLLEGLQDLTEISYNGLRLVAQSFIITREEIIAEKIGFLQQLYKFTQKLMNTFVKDEIVRLTTTEITSIFKVQNCCIALFTSDNRQQLYPCKDSYFAKECTNLIEDAWRNDISLFIDKHDKICNKIGDNQMVKLVAVPIQGHEQKHGVITLSNGGLQFQFGNSELELLRQFLYITAMVFENSLMFSSIEQNRHHLKLLTMRTVEAAEQERKRISEDIHDTLTQALTGISYKLQYCLEISSKNPNLVQEELSGLITTVRHAIDQSRSMITGLHPDIIDNIGLISALKRLIENFRDKTNIEIEFNSPENISLDSRLTICIYRVTQEVLSNIFKHANASTVILNIEKISIGIALYIIDNGRGFESDSYPFGMVDKGRFGLFYMQQRIESLGGKLIIKSQLKQGCEISAFFPYSE
jgi:signal transduction histidine kinase